LLSRVLEQGSRLSAVRLAQVHAACDVLGIQRGFDENDLYANLTWLSTHQEAIEKRLFAKRRGRQKPELFLYDVTSSYLEGECNAYGAYGYNRDGKPGKKQIVIGLLCDEQGEPVSTEVFRGNTQDPKTFAAQVKKARERFGCERVTFVGDRGMIT
jgi:transposase